VLCHEFHELHESVSVPRDTRLCPIGCGSSGKLLVVFGTKRQSEHLLEQIYDSFEEMSRRAELKFTLRMERKVRVSAKGENLECLQRVT
jgi:hypothetical protein